MSYYHGIRVSEDPTSVAIPKYGNSALQVVFGTSPVNMAEDPGKAVNKLILANTFAEAKAALGYCEDFENYTLCQVMRSAFIEYGVGPVIFCNVMDPSSTSHKEALSEAAYDVTNRQAVVNVFGVILENLIVKNGASTLTKDTDYITSFDENGYLVLTFISEDTESLSSVTVSGNKLKPSGVTETDVIGGRNASTGVETGIALVRQVYPQFGVTAALLLAPKWSEKTAVANALIAMTENINGDFSALAIVDMDSTSATGSTKYTDVPTAKQNAGYKSKNLNLLWPKVKLPSDGKIVSYSAMYAACIAYTDINNDNVPNLSPSNKELRISGTCLADGTDVYLDKEQANTLNANGIVTAINYAGWKTWGNNTAAYPENTDPKDRWTACRRFFIWWENDFIVQYAKNVDDPTNPRLVQALVTSENIRGNSIVAQGKCAGIRMEYIPDENPIERILDGHVKFRTHLAPYTPAEDILNVFEFDPQAIADALSM